MSRPKDMLYCTYCERKVRPIEAKEEKKFCSRLFTGLFRLTGALFTMGVSLIIEYLFSSARRQNLECPICGAVLKPGNWLS